MSKFDTSKHIIFSLVAIFVIVQSAGAQSILNFPRILSDSSPNTSIEISNPNPYYADVQLTLYGVDGNVIGNGLMNPVNYRVAPRSQLTMMANDLFAAGRIDGWIQATSTTSELSGFSSLSHPGGGLQRAESMPAYVSQVIPLLKEQGDVHSELTIINPGGSQAFVNVIFYDERGNELSTEARNMGPHELYRLHPMAIGAMGGLAGASAQVTSSSPVVASAVIQEAGLAFSSNGQPIAQQGSRSRIAPHFVSGNGSDSMLILTNPSADPIQVTVTLFSDTDGSARPPLGLAVAGHGATNLTSRDLAGLLRVGSMTGWLRIESSGPALNGFVALTSGGSASAMPIQQIPSTRFLFSQVMATPAISAMLSVVNPSASDADVHLALMDDQGFMVGQRDVTLKGGSRIFSKIDDLIPESAGRMSGFIAVRASSGVYCLNIVETPTGSPLVTATSQRLRAEFQGNPGSLPRILRVEPEVGAVSGGPVRITLSSMDRDTQVFFGSKALAFRFIAPGVAVIQTILPAAEPGFISLRVRVHGVDSQPYLLQVVNDEDPAPATVTGQAFYQKVEVDDSGLDLSRISMVPIRNARVEVVDTSARSILSVSETDAFGRFKAAVPSDSEVIVRVLSRQRSSDLRVLDNTSGDSLYSIEAQFDPRERSTVLLTDNSRKSGAFNILEMIQRGNDLLRIGDVRITAPSPAIFWSVRNTPDTGERKEGHVGTTFFNLNTNTAYILGDRNVDSDEFDDSVIIHEYAHMLAAGFSRDDSPGQSHGIGDILDPRVAWSEGWADFFSSAARNDPIFRDSRGVNGTTIFRMDLEENTPPNDNPGYWSEASVDSLLWDLFDDHPDMGDSVQYPFATIWGAFTDLRNDQFVYLPDFLDHFVARDPSSADAVRGLAQLRSMDYQPNAHPSVSEPFPKPIGTGEAAVGLADSLASKRPNLAQSSHFYTFTTADANVSIRLDITAPGPENNPNANDLDLFLTDMNGRLIGSSDRGGNGQPELISKRLPGGTYLIEIRSYYTSSETNSTVFNSGWYRLSLLAQ